MGFASAWLREKAVYPEFISEPPSGNTGIIVVVPAYDEPGLIRMLDSLSGCIKPACGTEVIIVINAPPGAPPEHIEGNKLAVRNIESWKKQNKSCFFRLFYIEPDVVSDEWGVGFARKTGMDEALRRFSHCGRADGVILCLDADCTVDENYLTAVENELLLRKDRNACSIYFEHPLSGTAYTESVYTSILLYELHLRYYYQGLVYSGFPYAFQTTGSAMAVRALEYMKAGGMNRKQAGEDFYFIQKLVPSGRYFYLTSTTVYPSPRTSYRVPFGTGASIQKLVKDSEPVYLTYNFNAFSELRAMFSMIESIHNAADSDLKNIYNDLPDGLRSFIGYEDWEARIKEIKGNTSGLQSFSKRFFGWFNMFRIVKYLNFVHQEIMHRVPVEIASAELLRKKGYDNPVDAAPGELIRVYRKLEKSI